MKLYELMKKKNMDQLEPSARQFVAKLIVKEVHEISIEQGISEQYAYELYSKGLFGSDREI